jgi:hypothetical protein
VGQSFIFAHTIDKPDHPKFAVLRRDEINAITSPNSQCSADPQRDGNSSCCLSALAFVWGNPALLNLQVNALFIRLKLSLSKN